MISSIDPEMLTAFELREYQKLMVERHLSLLKVRGITCDRSETGTGKTPVAMAVAAGSGATTVMVVCPKTLKSHWTMWAREYGFEKGDVGIAGWEEVKLGKFPHIYNKVQGWFRGERKEPGSVLIIFDEAHRSKSFKSQNAKMVRMASTSGAWLYLISATLIQSTLDLSGLAFPLRLIAQQSYWFPFAQKFGAGLNAFNAYNDFAAPHQLAALHQMLDQISVRVRKRDVVEKEMCITQVDLVDSANLKEIAKVYEGLAEKVAALEGQKNAAQQIIVERLRARQAAELLKVPVFVAEALRHLEEGSKVALFFNFQESVNEACRQFEIANYTVRSITGATPLKDRGSHIKEFNTGYLHVLVMNIQAGGEGISLHDTTGEYPRVCLLSPPESAGVLVQALGRIDRVGAVTIGLNRILFVARTAEELVYYNVRHKINRLSTLNDGDLAVPFITPTKKKD
jgi:superfamily II DNA or RNA helicase